MCSTMAPECLDADSHDVMSADGMRKLISALPSFWGNLNSGKQLARERKQENYLPCMKMYVTYIVYIVVILKLFLNVWEVFKCEELGIYSVTFKEFSIYWTVYKTFNDKIIYILVHN